MEINKDSYFKVIKNTASSNFKKKKTNQKQEQKHSQASSLDALGSYGKAQLNINFCGDLQSKKETVLKLINEACERYKNELNCPEDRKEEFLSEISVFIDEFCEDCDHGYLNDNYFKQITDSYIFNGYKKDNVQLLEKLINLKDDNGKYIFDGYSLFSMLNNKELSPEAEKVFFELLNLKTEDNKFRCNSTDLCFIYPKLNSQNIEFIDYLLDLKDKEGKYRLSGFDCGEILKAITRDNKDVFETLVEAKDERGNYRFNGLNCGETLKAITPDNKDSLEALLEAKDEQGKYRLDKKTIVRILEAVTFDNKDSLETLLEAKDEQGNCRLDKKTIVRILEAVTFDNKDIFKTLVEAKDEIGFYRFNKHNIADILETVTSDNIDIYETLLEAKDERGNYRFKMSGFVRTLKAVTPDNKDVLKTLLEAQDEKGNCRFKDYDYANILEAITCDNKDVFKTMLEAKDKKGNYIFTANYINIILKKVNKSNSSLVYSVIEHIKDGEATPEYLKAILTDKSNITLKDIKSLEHKIGAEAVRELSADEISLMHEFRDLINIQNINEIPALKKKEILRKLVQNNAGLFYIGRLKLYLPLIPLNQEEYCSLLPALVKSIGIETNILNDSEIKNAQKNISSLSNSLALLSDEEFNNLSISQQYSTDEFIIDVFNIVKDIKPEERQKVYDYFGFELHHNKNAIQVDSNKRHCFSITGYPINLNNGKKLAQIDNPDTKRIVETLRPYVIKYSKDNKINCNNKEIEEILNQIISVFPELRTQIGKIQHNIQDFDLFKHSLKVVQKISQNPNFSNLNASDKKIMLLCGLFHDLTKVQGQIDKTHPNESAFDSFYILKKLKLTKEEEIKLYSLIKNHEWLAYVNNKEADDIEKRMKSVAFDMQYDNLFDMAKIFTLADLKAVKADNSFYERFIDDFNFKTKEIEKLTYELKKTQPLLPVTKIPKASVIEKAITKVNPDGSTNLKGIYKDKSGLVVIKYNEVENETWDKIGFPKGSFSRGITSQSYSTKHGRKLNSADVDTGNIKFFAHGLDYSNQLYKFSRFALPDSDALLSVSYAERPESKYRFFRTQGVLLNADAKYIYGGGETDSGSGCGKNIDNFKENYVFGGEREEDREYISNLIKTTLNLDDEEYIEFVRKNANKSFGEIEPKETEKALIKAFATINSNVRKGEREYNEMYISNPEVMAVFAYDENDNVGNISKFISKQENFLKQYALDNDMPFIVFGD